MPKAPAGAAPSNQWLAQETDPTLLPPQPPAPAPEPEPGPEPEPAARPAPKKKPAKAAKGGDDDGKDSGQQR